MAACSRLSQAKGAHSCTHRKQENTFYLLHPLSKLPGNFLSGDYLKVVCVCNITKITQFTGKVLAATLSKQHYKNSGHAENACTTLSVPSPLACDHISSPPTGPQLRSKKNIETPKTWIFKRFYLGSWLPFYWTPITKLKLLTYKKLEFFWIWSGLLAALL